MGEQLAQPTTSPGAGVTLNLKALLLKDEADFLSRKFSGEKLPLFEMLETKIASSLKDSSGPIREMCDHIHASGGKRIRPLLVMYTGLVFGGVKPALLSAAVAAELIHMASLVHDDIIDESFLRRGRPSVNSAWENRYAVLCGDYLFARAFSILSDRRLAKSLKYMVEAIGNMCHGEILQAEERFRPDMGLPQYYDRISKKTAIFIECCCKSGAATAGADPDHIGIAGEFGLNLGLAFQMIDDILDYCGDPEEMGKPAGEDLLQGNITLPLILLLRNEKYKAWVGELLSNKESDAEAAGRIADALRNSGAVSEAFGIAASHIKAAEKCLELLPESPYAEYLYQMTGMLKTRLN